MRDENCRGSCASIARWRVRFALPGQIGFCARAAKVRNPDPAAVDRGLDIPVDTANGNTQVNREVSRGHHGGSGRSRSKGRIPLVQFLS